MNSPALLAQPRNSRPGPHHASTNTLKLRPGDIDLWRAALDEPPSDAVLFMQALMSADEAERARRFYFERDRRHFIVARGILRIILGRYLGLPPKELVFRYGPNGKPALAPGCAGPPPLFFNVAHSDGLALFAFTRAGEVGVDLEKIREIPELEQVAASSFSPREIARIYAAPESKRTEEFFRAWTRQEAVLKALGVGLGGSIRAQETGDRRQGTGDRGQLSREGRKFRVPLSPDAGSLSTDRPVGLSIDNPYYVHPLNPAPGFVAALAADRGGRWTTCRTWKASEPLAQFPLRRRGRRIRLERLPKNGATFL